MREAASARGYSLTHISRPVSGLDLLEFDLIIAMDDQNYQNLMNIAPSVEAARKVKRMSEYLTDNKISYIPDPYYSGMDGFNYVLDLLEESCENLFSSLNLKK